LLATHGQPRQKDRPPTRNPERTRERILAAASRNLPRRVLPARAWMGSPAGRRSTSACSNHYFGNKEQLFRAVLRHKIEERRAWAANLSSDPAERLPFWFKTACADPDWIRLLEWEALQGDGQKVMMKPNGARNRLNG